MNPSTVEYPTHLTDEETDLWDKVVSQLPEGYSVLIYRHDNKAWPITLNKSGGEVSEYNSEEDTWEPFCYNLSAIDFIGYISLEVFVYFSL